MPVRSITSWTAPCSAPPSEVKSFWYSIRTTAVFFGSTGMARAPLGQGGVGPTLRQIRRRGAICRGRRAQPDGVAGQAGDGAVRARDPDDRVEPEARGQRERA